MRIVTMIAGIVCLFAVLLDAFQTIILPRRASGRFRLTRIFYAVTWKPWVFFARRLRDPRKRESAFSYYGPLSLIFLLVVWAGAMVVGFALIFYSLGSPFNDSSAGARPSIRPLRKRNHHLHAGTGRRNAAQRLGARTHHSGGRHRFRLSGCRDGILSRSLRRIFAPRSQHLTARRAGRISADGRGADAPPFLSRARSTLSRCCLRSGNAGRRNCSRAISPIRCSAISARSITTRAGSAP